MTQEEKRNLLLIDLSARLPYHPRVKIWLKDGTTEEGPYDLQHNFGNVMLDFFYLGKIKDLKPYLRLMSSMTEEERKEWLLQSHVDYDCEFKPEPTLLVDYCHLSIDWLNQHHFDYRGLIEKGLAIEMSKESYYGKF